MKVNLPTLKIKWFLMGIVFSFALNDLLWAEASSNPEKEGQPTLWLAHVLRKKNIAEVIPEVGLKQIKYPVTLVPQGERFRPLVVISGYFNKPNWKLSVQNEKIPLVDNSGKGEFRIYSYLTAKVNEVTLKAEGPNQELLSETLYIFAPEAMEFQVKRPWDDFLVAFGASRFRYYQTNFGEYLANSGLLSIQYTPEIASRWGVITRLDLTVITTESTPVSNGPQLVEAKIDGAYTLGSELYDEQRWQLLFGQSYLTMLSNGSPFGFANLFSPEMGLRWRYFKTSKLTHIVDFRHVGVKGFLKKENYGLNLSYTISRVLSNSHRFESSVGFTNYSFKPDGETTVQPLLLYLALGYSI